MDIIEIKNEDYIAGLSIALQQTLVHLYKLDSKIVIPEVDRANESIIFSIAIAMKLTGYSIDDYVGDELTKSRIKLLMNRYLIISDSLLNLYNEKLAFLKIFNIYFVNYSFYSFLNEHHISIEILKHTTTDYCNFAEFAFHIDEFNTFFAKIEKEADGIIIYNNVITKGNLATAVKIDLEKFLKDPTKNI